MAITVFGTSGNRCPVARRLDDDAPAEFEFEPSVSFGRRVTPRLRVDGPPDVLAAVDEAVDEDPHVSDPTLLSDVGTQRLYRLTLDPAPDGVLQHLLAAEATVLSASGTPADWEFTARFDSQDALSAFHERCRRTGIGLDVKQVRDADAAAGPNTRLTPKQRETLVRARDRGYYDVPRVTTAVELADEVGISDQSLSERLRRAHRALVEDALL